MKTFSHPKKLENKGKSWQMATLRINTENEETGFINRFICLLIGLTNNFYSRAKQRNKHEIQKIFNNTFM